MKAKRLSKAPQLDLITTLPQAIIESILCLLPIEEAARTSILSRAWRYKWTTIPKLVFFRSTVKEPREEGHSSNQMHISVIEFEKKNKGMRRKLFNAIHQVLVQRQGPIHEFTLSVDANDTCFELDQIILNLLRNHALKKLTLALDEPCFGNRYCLPASVFQLHHLTDLYLEHCDVSIIPVFNGLASLTSLTLNNMWISKNILLHLLSSCSSLKRLCVKLENYISEYINPNFVELFKCLPLIEHLTTCRYMSRLVEDLVPGELLPSLIHLKYFCFQELWFVPGNEFAFLGTLFKCSPNLEKIKLEMGTYEDDEDDDYYYDEIQSYKVEEKYTPILKEYSDVRLEHLSELEIIYYRNRKLELEFVKFILARSPNLKKVILQTSICVTSQELGMVRNLPRASAVDIVVV